MNAEIICVGSELLLGQIVDTNATFLAQKLAELGINLYFKSTVGDNLERLVSVLKQAWKRSDLLILSGGLGPTLDDLTRQGLALLLDEELVCDSTVQSRIEDYFARRGYSMTENNLRQALRPESAITLNNPVGTAPGLWIEKDGKIVVSLPGVPLELKYLMEKEVLPRLERKIPSASVTCLVSKVLKVAGLGESAVEERILDFLAQQSNPTIAPLAKRGEVQLRITAKAGGKEGALQLIAKCEEEIRSRLSKYIFGSDQETLEEVCGRLLAEKGFTLGVAESCTGGLIGHRITEVSGSSRYFLGGVVAYSNELKTKLLGVDQELIQEHGAVSPEVAAAMATGMRTRYGADIAIATTGIAGPSGGSTGKPVGLVYLGLATAEGTSTQKRNFMWKRSENKVASAQAGLTWLWQYLSRL